MRYVRRGRSLSRPGRPQEDLLVRWTDDPLFDRLRRFHELVDHLATHRRGMDARDRWSPSVDSFETEAGLVLLVELAGVSPDDIDLSVEGKILTLSGFRPDPDGSYKLRLHRIEIDYGPFERRIALPEGLDPNGISATYRDGFLRVLVPRASGPGGGRIPIQEG